MRRWLWLAVGPLLVLLVGGALLLLLPEEEVKSAKTYKEVVVALPSGLQAEFHEMLWDRPGRGLVYRFRFVAPQFEKTDDVDMVMADMQHLCSYYALPKLANTGPMPGQVIISLADKPSEFGQYDPDVTQVFEAYSVKDGSCIWEMF